MLSFSPLNSAVISVSGYIDFSSEVNYDVNYKPDENPSDNPCAAFSGMPIDGYSFNIIQTQNSSLNFSGTKGYAINNYCDSNVPSLGWTSCPAAFSGPYGPPCSGACSEGGVYGIYINDDQVSKTASYKCNTSLTGEDKNSVCAQYIKDTEYACPASNFPKPDEGDNGLNFTLTGGCIAADSNGVIFIGEDYFEGFIPYKYYAIYNINGNPGNWGSIGLEENSNTSVSGSGILASKSYPYIAVFIMDLSTLPSIIFVNSNGSFTLNDTVETDATTKQVNYNENYSVTIQIQFY